VEAAVLTTLFAITEEAVRIEALEYFKSASRKLRKPGSVDEAYSFDTCSSNCTSADTLHCCSWLQFTFDRCVMLLVVVPSSCGRGRLIQSSSSLPTATLFGSPLHIQSLPWLTKQACLLAPKKIMRDRNWRNVVKGSRSTKTSCWMIGSALVDSETMSVV
jgi:hypothetical protein